MTECTLWETDSETHCDTCHQKWNTKLGVQPACPEGNSVRRKWIADHLKQTIQPGQDSKGQEDKRLPLCGAKVSPIEYKMPDSDDMVRCDCGVEFRIFGDKPICQKPAECHIYKFHGSIFKCDTCNQYYDSDCIFDDSNCPNKGKSMGEIYALMNRNKAMQEMDALPEKQETANQQAEQLIGIMDSSKNKFHRHYDKDGADILMDMAKTYRARSAQYGHNFEMVGKLVAVLWPNGVPPELVVTDQWHLFELQLTKISRFAVSNLTHIDSIHDTSIYGAIIEMILTQNEQEKANENTQG